VVVGSTIASSSIATSCGDLPIGPTLSDSGETGTTPSVDIIPIVGLMVYTPARMEGMMREPSVSVPRAPGANPTATPTADPEEDPPGFYLAYYEWLAQNNVRRALTLCPAVLPSSTKPPCT
jgi:hypothetical protein